ncbi:MAG TPA: YceH family protein [Solirubrobacteraceae bacterium]|nr:YceH family protein [Solirubrobacteraceae bacterium]
MDLDATEVRVLGCLIEKQRVTPDAYPLSLNGLRLACNQTTNRDPVVQYDEETIRAALHRLGRRRWTRLASGHGSRAAKYRHLLDEALGLDPGAMAVLAVLMLRGDQTPGELKQRTERMHRFADLAAVEQTLGNLMDRDLVARLERRPGQKEERYAHRLSEDLDDEPPAAAAVAPATSPPSAAVHATSPPPPSPGAATASRPAPPAVPPADDGRLERLEREVAELRAELRALREELGA